MDVLIFLTVVTFQVTLLAIVAIVFGQSKIAEQAIKGLTGILKGFTSKKKKDGGFMKQVTNLGKKPNIDPGTPAKRRKRKTRPVKPIQDEELVSQTGDELPKANA
ncbi:MAG: hypothetical protein AAF629_01495, partial [Chloroflexota bacterium]